MKRLSETDVIALFERFGAYRKDDHFVYASGKHGHEYLDKKALLADPAASAALSHEMYWRWIETSDDPIPDVVAGPEVSGADLAKLVMADYNRLLALTGAEPITSISIDKDGAGGFRLTEEAANTVRGRTVLLTEDILNTAGSLVSAAQAVKNARPLAIVGATVIWNRGGITSLPCPFISLVTRQLEAYAATDCPFCKQGRPINTKLGHGAEYLRSLRP